MATVWSSFFSLGQICQFIVFFIKYTMIIKRKEVKFVERTELIKIANHAGKQQRQLKKYLKPYLIKIINELHMSDNAQKHLVHQINHNLVTFINDLYHPMTMFGNKHAIYHYPTLRDRMRTYAEQFEKGSE